MGRHADARRMGMFGRLFLERSLVLLRLSLHRSSFGVSMLTIGNWNTRCSGLLNSPEEAGMADDLARTDNSDG